MGYSMASFGSALVTHKQPDGHTIELGLFVPVGGSSIGFNGTCVSLLPTDTPVPTPTPTPAPAPTPVPEIGLILNPPASSIRLAGTSTSLSVSGLTPGGTFTRILCDPNGACQSSQLMADADGKFTGTTDPLEKDGCWDLEITQAARSPQELSFCVAPRPPVDQPEFD